MATNGSRSWRRLRTILYVVTWTTMMDGVCLAAYDPFVFGFTRHSYNATIAENVRGRAFVTPDEKMGITMADPTLQVKYKITGGDSDKFFKAESKLVGDFCFLLIRTHTGNNDVLNRERRDEYVLQVRASVKSRGQHNNNNNNNRLGLRAKTQVRVTVLDTNDLSPLFHPTDYEVEVAEDAPLHGSVVRVSASDADIGVNGEVYYSLDPDYLRESNQFAIHPTSGVVSLARPLSHRDAPVHEFSVLAQDRGPKTTSATARSARVRVSVRRVNLHDPVISVQHLSSVVEEGNVDVYAIVRVTDEDEGVHGQIEGVDIVSGDPHGLFRMREAIGRIDEYNIVVLGVLDREAAPYGYNLTVVATDRGIPPRSSMQLVRVRVTDSNDHAPQFVESRYETSVEEVAPVGTPVLRVSAHDTDAGRNALVSYEIVGDDEDGSFVVDATNGVVKVGRPLDAETKREYLLTLMATDQGNSGARKSSTTTVTVRVTDNNDEDPLFVTSSSEVWLAENEPPGTPVFTARAVDSDQGENGYVSYSIANLSPTPFSIDHFTGEIRSLERLDYETQRRTYLLKVRASDWGSPYRRQTEMTLRVNLRDVNDNRPQFEKVDCVGQLYRRAPIRTPILTLSAVDSDAGDTVTYLIVSGNEDGCFELDSSSGVISLACSLDDVRAKERFLNVTATDGLNFADEMAVKMTLVNRQLVSFQCRDVGVAAQLRDQLALAEKNNNNNRGEQDDLVAQMPIRYGANRHEPRFVQEGAIELSVDENAEVGHEIGMVKAVDRDLGYNGQVVYVVSDGDVDGCFEVDMYKGALRLTAPLDRERRSSYKLNVTVRDLGRPQRSAWKWVKVLVDDVNDNPPVFDEPVRSLMVSEDVAVETVVVRLRATDADSGSNSRVAYSLLTDTDHFAVDAVDGTVKVVASLDREKQPTYELRVRATDGGVERTMSATAVVRVRLSDVNDNAPRFAMDQYTTRIREDVPLGTVLMALWARDPDLGAGGHVVYSLPDLSSDPDLPFDVDRSYGVIRLTKPLDFESRQMYNLSVRARDEGSPPMESTTHVLVEVMDVNENREAPKFDDFVLTGRVAENKAPGTFVMQVEAHDEDDPWSNDGKVIYSIRDGDGLGRFLIDEQGNIYTSEVFDRETSKRYWLSVFAQDRGAVPLHSRVEVYVEVTDENDNVPLTQEPAYFARVRENSPSGESVVKIDAYDLDVQPEQRITYRISNGNAPGFFDIDTDTGLVTTTGRRLDRELQDEHVLEVTVSDNGHPTLSSTTRVVVTVTDDNDHSPVFTEQLYRVRIPAMTRQDTDVSLFQVVAFDKDSGANADIDYTITSGKGNGRFKINPKTGMVYTQKNFTAGNKYELQIEAEDNGRPRRSAHTRVLVEVIEQQMTSQHPPVVHSSTSPIPIDEGQYAVHVTMVQADDPDGDKLWYSIIDGNVDDSFMIKHETGEVVLVKALDRETIDEYNLTVRVTDGVHAVKTQLHVKVMDANDHRPEFSESTYVVSVSENIPIKTEMLELKASDRDDNPTLLYYIHSSINPTSGNKFNLDPVRGILSVADKLDREACHQHVLTVMVKDDGIPTTRSNFARVVINVLDHNDHAPRFLADRFQGHVYETAAPGSSVVQVMAIDADKGKNAEIGYAIVSGNIGGTFNIHETLGTITVVKPLKLKSFAEYEYALVVKATDRGDTPLSSVVPVHVVVTMADNAPPKFDKKEYSTEIYENEKEGAFVINVHAISRSTVYYEIVGGNEMRHFSINPNSGVVTVARNVDYELVDFFNLTLRATNMVNRTTVAHLLVHILDANDNAPRFLRASYTGNVSEAAEPGTLVMVNNTNPLSVMARDDDSELNALLVYEIVDKTARKYFSIDPNTGAIRTAKALDYEEMREFRFRVQVSDMGKPRLTAEVGANVVVYVNDVNDCSPTFEKGQYNASILMPTFKNVVVTTVKATDADEASELKYEIVRGNSADKFAMDESSGVLTINDEENLSDRYNLTVSASDGKFSGRTFVSIVVDKAIRSGLIFAREKYVVNITENIAEVTAVAVLTVLGNSLDEHLEFEILNPGPMFTIGATSGVIWTKGLPFDREVQDSYTLIVEARSELEQYRVAQVAVQVNIMDENDNEPIFINLPYFAIVPLDAKENQVILKVQAIDKDIGDNGEVRYELSDGDKELFRVNSKTGDLALRKQLHDTNHELNLLVTAYDRGMEPRHTDVTVVVRVISRSMPLFNQQYYTSAVPESIQPYSPVLSVQANSPEGRKLIYSIVEGNSREEFAVDFNTEFDRSNGPCVIYVVDQLDYEMRQSYKLKLQATDAVSGAQAQVLVSITVEDVNDNAPEFSQTSYSVNVLETAPPSTVVLHLTTRDLDSGVNKLVQYTLQSDRGNASEYFHVDSNEAIISIKSRLDREQFASHHFTVIATDSGVPPLSSSTQVWVTVLDVNDNPPRFEQPTYHCFLSELATRGQFVTMVTAFDPDLSDQTKLIYTIVGGNDQQCFTINASSGVVTLMSLHKFSQQSAYTLNVSVSDGIYTSFTRVKVDIISSNRHSPQFDKTKYEVNFVENQPEDTLVTKLDATDEDRGVYGHVTYDIQSDASKELFRINQETGEIFSRKRLDREEREVYEVPMVAVDGGGHSGYTLLRVALTDVNDNEPKFRLGEYRANIHANTSIGTTILQVYATDDDDGANAMIEYSIYESDSSETNTTDKFAVNRESGEIYLKRSAVGLENQVYQFFVRARDFGKPPLESEVPVDIFIVGPRDFPPRFLQRANQFFVRENTPVGTVITSLDAQTNDTVSYSLVPNSGAKDEIFRIDEEGQVIVVGIVDREERVMHTLTVRAQTESSPPLTAFIDITIQVMDENDNDPVFESNPYRVSVAENMAEGSTVLKVVAHDRDLGYSAGLRYSLDASSENVQNVFAIDSATGWITTLVPLDREATAKYSFGVLAKDNGNPVRSATTIVHVQVEDYNDNPPRFTQDVYRAAVNEDALIGTVVITVSTTDDDQNLNSRVDYYLTAGDSFGHFQIQQTGEISVQKELDRESTASYRLEVTATDGTFVTTTLIQVEILDANDNPPVCKRVKYTERVSENVSVGSLIVSIEATDRDEAHNARLIYSVSGSGSSDFNVDAFTGLLKVSKPLDRESQSRYQLTAHVKDSDYSHWECTSDVEIFLSDINDNPPEFTQDIYSVTVPEDTEIRTLIGKVHATDRDLGANRKIKYSFVDSAGGHFAIDNYSGLVTLAKPLDREQRALYNLTVKATDQGVPQLTSLAHLLVIVLDINDNPPEFASRIYHASVTESASPGSDVVRVLATSRDSGINAEITYSIVAGNEHGKFAIHPKTGVVTVVQALDYEKNRDYYLTIQANDGGTPSLSNHATINVTVLDANDNAPIFAQTSYSAIVREDAQVGHKVLQVVATDLDSFSNSRISYFIIKGDPHGHFHVDKQNGYISVQSPLDRETIASYKIEIQSQDDGIPILSDTVMVNIDITDANDNPPVFSLNNYSTIVQEDKPLGFAILKFSISDADTPANGPPFAYKIVAGDEEQEFSISSDGVLRTNSAFNHTERDHYLLRVKVSDNGIPSLHSYTWVAVQIIEESRFRPVITPLEVTVSSYQDEFPGGILGRIKAIDEDPYDRLTFSLGRGHQHLFELDPEDGTLLALAGLDAGTYQLNISVSDGKFATWGISKVVVHAVTDQMLENALVIRFEGVTPEAFIISYQRNFVKAVQNHVPVRASDVLILSMQPSPHMPRNKRNIHQDLDVMFAVRRGEKGFYPKENLRKILREGKSKLEMTTELKIVKIYDNLCTADRCVRGECLDHLVLDEMVVISVTTDSLSYVSPQHHHRVECRCQEGYGGEICDQIINDCAKDPCPKNTICIADSSAKGYSCQCQKGKFAPGCNDEDNCVDQFCYKEKRPITFHGKSYARYTLVNPMDKRFSLKLFVRTSQPTGCLKYSAGRVDYSILEIVNGVVQYRFNCGSGEGIVRVEHVHINDRKWHEIFLERHGNKAELIVDGKSSSQGSTPGINDVLNIESNEIYFGAQVHPHPTIPGYDDVRLGFVGCLDAISIDRVTLPLFVSNGNSVATLGRVMNVDFQCSLSGDLGACGTQPCVNGGTCKPIDEGAGFVCHCHTRFVGEHCEVDTNPCASNPCLFGGTCSNLKNDFHCTCPDRLSGKRCDYGRYCNPNPCRHGGVCEEGSHGPMCKCRGFHGEFCEMDVDECAQNPCYNGGRCLNAVGSFICECGPNATGALCDNLVVASGSITSSSMNITIEEIVGIVATVLVLIVLVLLFVAIRKFRAKRAAQRRLELLRDPPKDVILKNKTHDDLKRNSKLSNLEAPHTLMLPPRPASYTPSRHDSVTALNNFDTVRSYGSAADDLENIPKYNTDFLQNITKNNTAAIPTTLPATNQTPESESLHKPAWDLDHNLKESYPDNKIHNVDLKSSRPAAHNTTPSHHPMKNKSLSTFDPGTRDNSAVGRDNLPLVDDMPAGHACVAGLELIHAISRPLAASPQANNKGYHWDCSDWARSQNPLPNITEVPTNEVPDSPSLHSNESNSRVDNASATPPVDIDSEYVGDSEYNDYDSDDNRHVPLTHPSFDELLSLSDLDFADDYDETDNKRRRNYKPLHPDQYLPTYSIATDTENEDNGYLLQIDDDEPPPYTPLLRKINNAGRGIGSAAAATAATLDAMSMSLGDYTSTNASCSDLSDNLCEIEDSEVCSETDTDERRTSYSTRV